MNIDDIRKFCLGLPGATEDVKWGADLTFCVGAKMFAVTGLESTADGISLKCTPEKFAELVERDGIIPAPYVARYHWVKIEGTNAVTDAEMKTLIRESYKMVRDKLPKKERDKIEGNV
jgi:predicted DNA-binding protein (MmcQ/YjbR family)